MCLTILVLLLVTAVFCGMVVYIKFTALLGYRAAAHTWWQAATGGSGRGPYAGGAGKAVEL